MTPRWPHRVVSTAVTLCLAAAPVAGAQGTAPPPGATPRDTAGRAAVPPPATVSPTAQPRLRVIKVVPAPGPAGAEPVAPTGYPSALPGPLQDPQAVPEPRTVLLVATGIAASLWAARRWRTARRASGAR